MSKADSMIGKKFGEWLALEKRDNRKILCRCSCGVEREVSDYSLSAGLSTNCGHKRLAENLVGNIYGQLEVIAKGNRSTYWICRCSCGKIIEVSKYKLEHGKKTCGHVVGKNDKMLGKTFGMLTIVDFNYNTGLWICQCECGNSKEASTKDLNAGNIKSCGNHQEIHILGQVFGDLTVMSKNKHNSQFICKCNCGGTITVSGKKLLSGEVTHCNSIVHKGPVEDLQGRKFTRLTVISFNQVTRLWECVCDCGNTKYVKGADLVRGAVKSCGCLLNSPKTDLTGRVFGKLKVVEYIKNGKYKCECECGNTRIVPARSLLSGQTTKCKQCRDIDLTGQVINELTVLHRDPEDGSKWICKCSCGKITSIQTGKLTHKLQLSCGHIKDSKFIDLTGQRFGKLTVVGYLGNQSWICKCDCGKETTALGHNLRHGGVKSCGCSTIEAYKKSMLDRYGDTNSRHINSPRYHWQIDILENKENFNAFIIKLATELNRYPMIDELANMLGVTRYTIKNYTFKYGLDMYNCSNTMEDSLYSIYSFMERRNRKVLGGLEIDLLDPEHSIGIEFNGNYWHSDIYLDKYYHQNKTLEAKKKGIRLIHIFEYEWKDSVKRDKLLKLIDRAVKPHLNKLVYGRNTFIKLIDVNDSQSFLNQYHIDGYTESKYNIGCFYKSELIGVMSIEKSGLDSIYEYEITRLSWKDNIVVVGGLQKIIKFVVNTLNINKILAYIDASKFNCNGYIAAGFKFSNDYLSDPSYAWVKGDEVLYSHQIQKKELAIKYPEYSELAEDDIMVKLGYYKIYNCGNYKLYYNKEE